MLRPTRRHALLLGAGPNAGPVLSGTGTATPAVRIWNRPCSANGRPVVICRHTCASTTAGLATK